jgi:hypothetical protein
MKIGNEDVECWNDLPYVGTPTELFTKVPLGYRQVYYSPMTGKLGYLFASPPPTTVSFTDPNQKIQSSIESPPICYTLPPLTTQFMWSTQIIVTGGGGIPNEVRRVYPGGKQLYVYVGAPRVILVKPSPPLRGIYVSGGMSAVFETCANNSLPSDMIVRSIGGTSEIVGNVDIILTMVIAT